MSEPDEFSVEQVIQLIDTRIRSLKNLKLISPEEYRHKHGVLIRLKEDIEYLSKNYQKLRGEIKP